MDDQHLKDVGELFAQAIRFRQIQKRMERDAAEITKWVREDRERQRLRELAPGVGFRPTYAGFHPPKVSRAFVPIKMDAEDIRFLVGEPDDAELVAFEKELADVH